MKMITTFVLATMLVLTPVAGCVSTSDGHSIQALEQMSEQDFNKWQLYLQLGTKIGANRLLAEGVVDVEDLEKAAAVIETARDQTFVPGTKSLLKDALKDSGLTNDELELLITVIDQELLSRGAFEWLNPATGVIELSTRAKALLTIVASALRSATVVTESEVQQGMSLESEFRRNLL